MIGVAILYGRFPTTLRPSGSRLNGYSSTSAWIILTFVSRNCSRSSSASRSSFSTAKTSFTPAAIAAVNAPLPGPISSTTSSFSSSHASMILCRTRVLTRKFCPRDFLGENISENRGWLLLIHDGQVFVDIFLDVPHQNFFLLF